MNSDKPTLYDQLGGVYAIATVVDDFIDRVMSNPILNANPCRRRGTSPRQSGWLQVFGYGDGVLGLGWSAAI